VLLSRGLYYSVCSLELTTTAGGAGGFGYLSLYDKAYAAGRHCLAPPCYVTSTKMLIFSLNLIEMVQEKAEMHCRFRVALGVGQLPFWFDAS
jgi:hypothetical protein